VGDGGQWSIWHKDELLHHPLVNVVAATDQWEASSSVTCVFGDVEALLRHCCRPNSFDSVDNPTMLEVDAVVVGLSSDPAQHCAACLSAVRKGLHVFSGWGEPRPENVSLKLQDAALLAREEGTIFMVMDENYASVSGFIEEVSLAS